MTRNVLLMFSTDQPPDPVEELRWHAPQCVVDDTTAVVTTRVLTGLTPDRSTVAFYGSQALGNDLLARGTFGEYIPLGTDRGGRSPVRIPCTIGEECPPQRGVSCS